MTAIMHSRRAAAFLLLLWSRPTSSFLSSTTAAHHHHTTTTTTTALGTGTDAAANLLYQEQEKIIIQRGELEETFVTDTKPLEASKVKIRGAGESHNTAIIIIFCSV